MEFSRQEYWCGAPLPSPEVFCLQIFKIFIYLAALVALSWLSVVCSEWGLLFIVVHRLLIAVASLIAEYRL